MPPESDLAERSADGRVSAELLRLVVRDERVLFKRSRELGGVLSDGVEVGHIGIRRDRTLTVERRRNLDQARVAAAAGVQ